MTVVLFTVCFTSCFMICVLCQRGLFIPGVCPETLEKPSYVAFSLPQVNSSIFFRFSNLLYCTRNVSNTSLEIQRPIRGKESQSHSSFFSTLFTWWRIWWMLGACRTHPGRSCWFECLLLCVIMTFELLHKIFLQNYHQVSFILSFFFSFQLEWFLMEI